MTELCLVVEPSSSLPSQISMNLWSLGRKVDMHHHASPIWIHGEQSSQKSFGLRPVTGTPIHNDPTPGAAEPQLAVRMSGGGLRR